MTKSIISRDQYIYPCTYVRCLEKNLLTREKADKMLAAGTLQEAMQVLYEMGYGDSLEDPGSSDFESLLSLAFGKASAMILRMAPRKECFAVFLYPHDYHNAKTLLKAEFLGIDAASLLSENGSIPAANLADMIRNRSYTEMRPPMARGIGEVIEAYGTSKDPQLIDLILDKACYQDIYAEAVRLKNDFVKGYVKLKIDTINLKTWLRTRQMKKPWDFFKSIFIDGGNIPESLFHDGYEMNTEHFGDKLWKFGLETVFLEGAAELQEYGRFTVLEKLCDDLLTRYMQDAKYISYGIEPLIAYMAAVENDIRTARIILSGKLAGLGPEIIRERIRDTYA